jgi:putative glutamine amidotransferase
MKQRIIAVSKLAPNYQAWLQNLDPEIVLADFEGRDPAEFRGRIQEYSGLVLTGGGDIHPSLYGYQDTENHCRGIDVKRDELEFRMLEAALTGNLPILAICRGLQVLNVFLGGTLIPHIPALPGKLLHKDGMDVNHQVIINHDSQLFRISGTGNETVNSSHHQAIDKPGEGLIATAFSPDGVIEAAELKVHEGRFCFAVQWHPERMVMDNPLSGKIGLAFMEASKK